MLVELVFVFAVPAEQHSVTALGRCWLKPAQPSAPSAHTEIPKVPDSRRKALLPGYEKVTLAT